MARKSITYPATTIVDSPLGEIKVTITAPIHIARREDENGWEHYEHTAYVTYQGRTLRTPYSRGTATGPTVEPTDILTAIARDAQSADQSFTDFCENFGYDTDSRSAYAIYEACDHMWNSIRRVFAGRVREFYEYTDQLDA